MNDKQLFTVSKFAWIYNWKLLFAVTFIVYLAWSYHQYTMIVEWRKAVALTRQLQEDISKCLIDHKSDGGCHYDTLMLHYEVRQPRLPNDNIIRAISILDNVSIRIEGTDKLGKCIMEIVPTVNEQHHDRWVSWDRHFVQSSYQGADSLDQCESYLRSSIFNDNPC